MEIFLLNTFGGLEIKKENISIEEFRSNTVLGLFIYLCVEGRGYSRDYLAEFFWPQSTNERALANLRVAINNLKTIFGDAIVINKKQIKINLDFIKVDTLIFESKIKQCDFNEFQSLYRGQFLQGFSLPSNNSFEEWIRIRSLYYSNTFERAIKKKIEEREINGDLNNALVLSGLWMNIESNSLIAFQIHHALLLKTNRFADAEKIKQILNTKFSWTDESDLGYLTKLRIKDPRDQIEKTFNGKAKNPDWFHGLEKKTTNTIISRQEELNLLNDSFNKSKNYKSQVVLISGEPGSGKSTLLKAFLSNISINKEPLLMAFANTVYTGGTISPFFVIRTIVYQLLGNIEDLYRKGIFSDKYISQFIAHSFEVFDLFFENYLGLHSVVPIDSYMDDVISDYGFHIPEYCKKIKIDDFDSSSKQFYMVFVNWIKKLTKKYPLILIFDDFHLYDLASAGLINLIIKNLNNKPVFIVVTYRKELIVKVNNINTQELRKIIIDIQTSQKTLIDLDSINENQSLQYVHGFLSNKLNQLPSKYINLMAHLSHGNPLYVEDFWQYSIDKKIIKKVNKKGWVLKNENLDLLGLPERIENLLSLRFENLTESIENLLMIASVEGEIFSANTIAKVTAMDINSVVRILAKLIHLKLELITFETPKVMGSDRLLIYRFRHAIYKSHFYQKMDPYYRETIHLQIAEVLENRYQNDEDKLNEYSAIIGNHFFLSHKYDKALHFLSLAGNYALKLNAFDDAVSLYKKSLLIVDQIGDQELRKETEIKLQISLLSPLQAIKGYKNQEVKGTYDRLNYLVETSTDSNIIKSCLYLLRIFYPSYNDWKSALAFANKIIDTLDRKQNPLLVALAHWTLGYEQVYQGKFIEAQSHLQVILNNYQHELYDWVTQLYGNHPGIAAHTRMSWVSWFLGKPDQAKVYAEKALNLAEDFGHTLTHGFTIGIAGVLLNQMRGDILEMKYWNDVSNYLSHKEGIVSYTASEAFSKAYIRCKIEKTGLALRDIETAWDMWKNSGAKRHASQYSGMLAEVYLEAGFYQEGLNIINSGLNCAKEANEHYFEPELLRIRGCLYRALKEYDLAEFDFLQAIQITKQQLSKMLEIKCSVNLALLWLEAREINRAYNLIFPIYKHVKMEVNEPIYNSLIDTYEKIIEVKQKL